jgi:hypothetical protein
VAVEVFNADRQMDTTKLIVVFSNSENESHNQFEAKFSRILRVKDTDVSEEMHVFLFRVTQSKTILNTKTYLPTFRGSMLPSCSGPSSSEDTIFQNVCNHLPINTE